MLQSDLYDNSDTYMIYSSRGSKSETNITEEEVEIAVRLMLTLMLILQ